MNPSIATIQKNNWLIHYRPGTADESVINESFENDLLLRTTPEYTPQPDHTVLDIGAHIGCFSMLMASKIPQGKVYAFEPSADTFSVLQQNILHNNLQNVHCINKAVAAHNGTAELFHDLQTGNWGHSITRSLSASSEKIFTISLQHFIEQEQLQKIDFIKFNCEGAEFEILLNTPKEYFQRIGTMLVLYHEELVNGQEWKDIAGYLKNAGFKVHHRNRDKATRGGRIVAYRASGAAALKLKMKQWPLVMEDYKNTIQRKWRRALHLILPKTPPAI